jgi:hypothetical protein
MSTANRDGRKKALDMGRINARQPGAGYSGSLGSVHDDPVALV